MLRQVALTLAFAAVLVAPASHAFVLGPAVFGSAGGVGAGGSFRLGLTLGQPVTGAPGGSIAPNDEEGAGFWRWGHRLTLAVPPNVDPLVAAYALYPAAPTPFATRTLVRYAIPTSAGDTPVLMRIFDLSGRLVRTLDAGTRAPGMHALVWDGHDDAGRQLGGGVYFCRVTAGSFAATRRLVLTH